MTQVINYETSETFKKKTFVDLRSPSEYKAGTIPSAINIPLFTDEQRHIIGKIYKRESKTKAIELGYTYGNERLKKIMSELNGLNKHHKIILFCARGGYRSSELFGLLKEDSRYYRLKNGYKGYRKHVIQQLPVISENSHFIVLHGYTGAGKTLILQQLHNMDFSIMNLEKLARNAGSVFGDLIFEGTTPSQKNFESELYRVIHTSRSKYIVTESESKRIGKVFIPNKVYDNIYSGKHILIKTSTDNRVDNLLQMYHTSNISDLDLQNSISLLKKRLGSKKVKDLHQLIEQGQYKTVAKQLIVEYYDPMYRKYINEYKPYDYIIEYDTLENAVKTLKEYIERI